MKYGGIDRRILRSDLGDEVDYASDSLKGLPMPPVQKNRGAEELIDLVDSRRLFFAAQLQDVISKRRSHRKFTHESLNMAELSFLLWATQGITDPKVAAHRAVPSVGARHPFESYLVVRDIEGLAPGVYHYSPLVHKLGVVARDAAVNQQIVAACPRSNRTQIASAAVVFVWAAVPYRTEWRIGPAAYKCIAIDVGHTCQNLYLAAEAVGAGACAMAAYDQQQIDRLIQVDGRDEFAVYLACVGKVQR